MKSTWRLFIFLTISFLISCGGDTENDIEPKKNKKAELEFSTSLLDFGSVIFGKTKELELVISNKGNAVLEVNSYDFIGDKESMFNTNLEYNFSIKPGKSKSFKCIFTSSKIKFENVKFEIRTNIGNKHIEIRANGKEDDRPVFVFPPDIKDYVVNMWSTIDVDSDGKLQLEEVRAYEGELHIRRPFKGDFSPLYEFKNLKSLIVIHSDNFIDIDFSKFKNLTKLQFSGKKYKSIDISKNLNLEELILVETNISSLDISNNINIKALYINENKITDLDISNNKNIEFAYIRGSYPNFKLENLDFSHCENLDTLFAVDLSNTDFSTNPKLKDLVTFGDFRDFNLSNCLKLEKIALLENDLIESIDLSKHTDLIEVNFRGSDNIVKIDLSNSNNEKLKRVKIGGSACVKVDEGTSRGEWELSDSVKLTTTSCD